MRGQGCEREATVSGWPLIGRTEAHPSSPPAVRVVKDQAQGGLWRRALGMPTPADHAATGRVQMGEQLHRRLPQALIEEILAACSQQELSEGQVCEMLGLKRAR